MSKLRLTFACWDYDRIQALAEGRVQADGIDLNMLQLPVEETFFRMLRNREFDCAEMSLSSYTVSLSRDPKPFIAIPVFSVALLSALLHFRVGVKRHPRAARLDWSARRRAGVSDDRAGVDSRHLAR